MGCDIHMFIEYKIGDGAWVADKNHVRIEEDEDYSYIRDASSTGRDYDFFAALAGVRGDGPDAKGLPEDVSEIIKQASEDYGVDGHSHSYNSLQEFKKIYKALTRKVKSKSKKIEPIAFSDDYSHGFLNLIAYCEKEVIRLKTELAAEYHLLGSNITPTVECRLVYYFDN